MNLKNLKLTAAAGLFLAAHTHAQDATAITGVTVVDVQAGRLLPGSTVVLRDGLIERVDQDNRTPPPADATLVDGSGKFLIPGLFDAHVHYIDPATYGPMMIACGVTFVRDLGGPTEGILSTRARLADGSLLGPEMVCTGAIIDGDPPVWPFSEPCDTPEEAQAAVRKLHQAGVDQIKVYTRLQPEVYRAAVAEAHALGLKAVGHVPAACTLDDAIAAGQDDIEHLTQFDEMLARLSPAPEGERGGGMFASFSAWYRLPQVDRAALRAELKKLADARLTQCPTLVVMAGIASLADPAGADEPLLQYTSPAMTAFWGAESYQGFARAAGPALPQMKAMVKELFDAGVPLMVGTDLANPRVFAGFSVHKEMSLFAEAGIPAADTLRAATITPAKFLGQDGRCGTVEKGKAASLVLLTADPLADINNTMKIDSVFFRGKHYDRAALDGLLDQARRQASGTAPVPGGDVALDLPGEVVLRGRYEAKFGAFDAGDELVLVTRTPEGMMMIAHTRPKGGMQAPAISTWSTDPSGAFRSGTWKQLTDPVVETTYAARGNTIIAESRTAGAELQTQEFTLPEGAVFGPPTNGADLFTLPPLDLQVGQSLDRQAIGFGYPDWRVAATPLKVTREPDTTLETADGRTVPVRLYTQVLTTPMGEFTIRSWTDARGIVVRTITKMPFGTLTADLKEDPAGTR